MTTRLRYHIGSLFLMVACIILDTLHIIRAGTSVAGDEGIFLQHTSTGFSSDSIFFIYHGRLEIAANITAIASQMIAHYFPQNYMWIVCRSVAAICLLIPFFLFIHYRAYFKLGVFLTLAYLIIVFGLPQSFIVLKPTSSREHFYFFLATAYIFFLPALGGRAKYGLRVLLAVSGLSGLTANFMGPSGITVGINPARRSENRWLF